MPPPYGLTLDGFNPMRLQDVFDQLADDLRAQWGQNIRTDDRSVIGQLIGVFAERLGDLWAESENVYAAAYLHSATGAALDDLVALAAIARREATLSLVTLSLSGTNGTLIPAGSIVRDPETLERWVTLADATIAAGVATTTANPERTGPVIANASTLTEIVTPISGWTSVTNPLDAERGRDQESDAALRARFLLTMRIGGGSAVEAIRASILRLESVLECLVIENESIEVVDGMPPKSFECVVRGGTDQEIVNAIWFGKPAGIETTGNTSGTALDSVGDPHTVEFTRPSERAIYMIVRYTPLSEFEDDGEAQIEEAILDFASTFTVGKDVISFEFVQHIEVPNIEDLEILIGFMAGPTDDATLAIARREIATFDSSRITFEVV